MAAEIDDDPQFEYIVVGVGSAGAALARRLSCQFKVLALENGTKDDNDPPMDC